MDFLEETWDASNRQHSNIGILPKTQSVLVVKRKGNEHLTRTTILLRLADAQLELKLEKRDHDITKK